MTEYADVKPLYVHRSTVWFDELDMVGVLHNARYAIHVERAMSAWYHSLPDQDPSDSVVVVRQYNIEFLRPFTQQRGELVIECGVGKLGTTSAIFTFRALSYPADADGTEIEHARGIRAIVKVDPQTLRPTPWSDRYRELFG
ncbi:MAG TPA: hotdog domain-containing protein [Actinocrinis sp.]|nr:hotdog domain-containing protein [Actinocrinis sp.]